MTTQGHAAAMHQCIANSCRQGRVACPAPMTCSGATALVDESIQHWQLHRLQEVEAVEARWTEPRATVYLAPGVIDGPAEPDEFTRTDTVLATCARWIFVALIAWVVLYVAAGYIAAFFRLL